MAKVVIQMHEVMEQRKVQISRSETWQGRPQYQNDRKEARSSQNSNHEHALEFVRWMGLSKDEPKLQQVVWCT